MTTPQHLSDRYELGDILGFGGMSEVHLARDLRLKRNVAVKVLRADLARDPSFYLRFRREAQNAAALNHPAIVAVHDTGEADTADGPLPYIVMEYVEGVTLRDIVRTDGPMESQRAIEVIADACQALNFSHQHGIIHRDVKPANIMISKTGAVKVMDFGIARALADSGIRLTQTAAVIGTAQYLSPEQARGETVDARSDVYSLGCVLYEMLTGEPPFVGDSPVAVAYQHVREAPVPPSQRHAGIAPELDAVVLKALAKNPENRYQTAADMRTDLIRVHTGKAPGAPKVLTDAERPSPSTTAPSGGRTPTTRPIPLLPGRADRTRGGSIRRWLIAVAVLAVLAVAGTVAFNVAGFRDAHVPDVTGLTSTDAISRLQNAGFKTRQQPKSDSQIPTGHVIGTDPGANAVVGSGDEITVNVSSGPDERQVPDVANLSYADAERKLNDAGFDRLKPTDAADPTVPAGLVIDTVPAASSTVAITDEITVRVSGGPDAKPVPDVSGQTVEQATTNLDTVGFKTVLVADLDSPLPAGQVVATDPPAGTSLSVDTAITLKVSNGKQFVMPTLVGLFYDDLLPQLQGLGFVGQLLRGPDVPGVADRDRNRVVRQDPPPGTGVSTNGTITLNYGS